MKDYLLQKQNRGIVCLESIVFFAKKQSSFYCIAGAVVFSEIAAQDNI